MSEVQIIDTSMDNILDFGVCGYKSIKREGFPQKVAWLKDRFDEGLKLKTLHSVSDGTQGMIEYLPGEYCWRPVEASGYMFIHCVFSGFKKGYKNKGYGSMLLEECLKDAQKENAYGIAVVTRKGPFMANRSLFLKHGFEVADTAPSDFELMVKKMKRNAPVPRFKGDWEDRRNRYNKGLTIIRADQCPYTVKNVNEISELAQKEYGLKPAIINLANYKEAQESPCAFGTFCMLYDGKVVAEHPISKGRFANIMKQIRK